MLGRNAYYKKKICIVFEDGCIVRLQIIYMSIYVWVIRSVYFSFSNAVIIILLFSFYICVMMVLSIILYLHLNLCMYWATHFW